MAVLPLHTPLVSAPSRIRSASGGHLPVHVSPCSSQRPASPSSARLACGGALAVALLGAASPRRVVRPSSGAQRPRRQGRGRRRLGGAGLGRRAAAGPSAATASTDLLFDELSESLDRGDAGAAQAALRGLKDRGAARLFESYPQQLPSRRVELFDLKQVGIRTPDQLVTQPDNTPTAIALCMFFGLAAALTQSAGFWVTSALLTASFGSIWVGAFAPQLLPSDSEEKERLQAHEAAHFLVGYLLGAPIRNYSVDASGNPSVEFEDRVGPLAGSSTSREALDAFCVVACAGIAGEGQLWDSSFGGAADLRQLSKALGAGGPSTEDLTSPRDQLNYTRWGVFYAASMLRAHKASWFALRDAMAGGADLCGCIRAVEAAAVS